MSQLIVGCEALGEQLELLTGALDSSSEPQPRLVFDRDLAEVAVDIQGDEAHVASCLMFLGGRPGGQNDTDGFVLSAQPGESQGRPQGRSGSQPTPFPRPAHPAFSQKPLSRWREPMSQVGHRARAPTRFSSPG